MWQKSDGDCDVETGQIRTLKPPAVVHTGVRGRDDVHICPTGEDNALLSAMSFMITENRLTGTMAGADGRLAGLA